MIYRHKDTGLLYKVLATSFDTSRQEHHVVYLQMETGRVFNRNAEDFDKKFELIDDDPQREIQPKVDY